MENITLGTGALPSPFDSRTFIHDTTQAAPVTEGGVTYLPEEIEMQANVGICTAISLTQNAKKATGIKYSAEFQYLCQKRYIDQNGDEGSSIFSALRVGKNIGLLPAELFTAVTEADRTLDYASYWKKLNAVTEDEMTRLKGLCTLKLSGYAAVPTDPGSLAAAIYSSKAGILTMYRVGVEWFTPSWNASDIDPLKAPKNVISGHAITKSYFNLSTNLFTLANTWSSRWNTQGSGHVNYTVYFCQEAWIPYYDTVPPPALNKFIFTHDMSYGDTSNDVTELQKRLISLGFSIPNGPTGYYGTQTAAAVYSYQLKNVSLSLFERIVGRGHSCGPKTRAVLNKI